MSSRVEELKAELLQFHKEHLESHGVVFPRGEKKLAHLLCLYEKIGEPVSRKELGAWMGKKGFEGNTQARHLADFGWNLASGDSRYKRGPKDTSLARDQYMLVNVTEPNPVWLLNKDLKKKKKAIPSKKKCEELFQEIEKKWSENLEPYGVKLPTSRSKVNRMALIALYYNLGKPMYQDDLALWFKKFGLNYKFQARSLAQDGWFMETGDSRGFYIRPNDDLAREQIMLVSIDEPNPRWLGREAARTGDMSKLTWEEKLLLFKERGCAVCGAKAGHYDKGHLESSKPSDDENIVPMCVPCNNWAGRYMLDFKMIEGTLIARPDLSSWIKEE